MRTVPCTTHLLVSGSTCVVLVFGDLLAQGWLEEVENKNQRKAELL